LDANNTLESFDEGFKEDDRMIKHYAKKLGIKDERINEGIIPDAFKMDGLDCNVITNFFYSFKYIVLN